MQTKKKYRDTECVQRRTFMWIKNGKSELIQIFLNNVSKSNLFNAVLYIAITSVDITLSKLNNLNFFNFLFKYTGKNLSVESKLKKNYAIDYSNNTINPIRIYVKNKKICVIINENTVDIEGQYVINVIIGTLEIWYSH